LGGCESSAMGRAVGSLSTELNACSCGLLTLFVMITMLTTVPDFLYIEGSNYIPVALNFSDSEYGQLTGGGPNYLRAALNFLIVGELIDNVHRTHYLAALAFLASACIVWFGASSTDFSVLLLAKYLWNVVIASVVPVVMTLIVDMAPESMISLAISLAPGAVYLSDTVALALVSIFRENWRASFFINAGILFCCTIAIAFVPEKDLSRRSAKLSWSLLKDVWHTAQTWASVLVTCPSILLLLLALVFGGAMYGTTAFLQLWLVHDHGIQPARASADMTVMPLVQGLGSSFCAALADFLYAKHGWSRLVTTSLLATLSPLLLILLVHIRIGSPGGDSILWLCIVIQQFFIGPSYPNLSAAVITFLPPKLLGSASAFSFGSFTIGFAACVQIGFEVAGGWQSEHVSFNGHPGTYSLTLRLLACVILLEVPLIIGAFFLAPHDEQRIQKLTGETDLLLPLGTEGEFKAHSHSGTTTFKSVDVVGEGAPKESSEKATQIVIREPEGLMPEHRVGSVPISNSPA